MYVDTQKCHSLLPKQTHLRTVNSAKELMRIAEINSAAFKRSIFHHSLWMKPKKPQNDSVDFYMYSSLFLRKAATLKIKIKMNLE